MPEVSNSSKFLKNAEILLKNAKNFIKSLNPYKKFDIEHESITIDRVRVIERGIIDFGLSALVINYAFYSFNRLPFTPRTLTGTFFVLFTLSTLSKKIWGRKSIVDGLKEIAGNLK